MKKLKKIFNLLLSHFGTKLWWPVTEKYELYPKYTGGPKNEKQQLEVIFGAILTQNTNWNNVQKAIVELNKKDLIDVKKIINIDIKELAILIRSSGYHNQKAKRLKNFCNFLLKNYNGELALLFDSSIPKIRKELLEINGIGSETADSIILYAAHKPVFVVDAYTKRILSRLGYEKSEYDELQKLFMDNLPNNEKLFNEYHALIVELGKNTCKKIPLCQTCPINMHCNYFVSQDQ